MINQFTIHSRNPFNKAYTNKTVKNSTFKIIDVFNKNLVTSTADQLKGDAKTTKGNLKHA